MGVQPPKLIIFLSHFTTPQHKMEQQIFETFCNDKTIDVIENPIDAKNKLMAAFIQCFQAMTDSEKEDFKEMINSEEFADQIKNSRSEILEAITELIDFKESPESILNTFEAMQRKKFILITLFENKNEILLRLHLDK
jgi:recombination DNA repair RAD52 pathway protein